MSLPEPWRKGPRPDPSVIELLEQLQAAARKGHIRAIAVVVVDPMLTTAPYQAGELDHVRAHLISAGLMGLSTAILLGAPSASK